jgi:hypothetical protein
MKVRAGAIPAKRDYSHPGWVFQQGPTCCSPQALHTTPSSRCVLTVSAGHVCGTCGHRDKPAVHSPAGKEQQREEKEEETGTSKIMTKQL